MSSSVKENVMLDQAHFLIYDPETIPKLSNLDQTDFDQILANFCGIVVEVDNFDESFCKEHDLIPGSMSASDNIAVYVAGDVAKILDRVHEYVPIESSDSPFAMFYFITICCDFAQADNYPTANKLIRLGEVPRNLHNVGVWFPMLFDDHDEINSVSYGSNYFKGIDAEHSFQSLTESNKESNAYRKGIYITKITEIDSDCDTDSLQFKLLRCSSNFDGPTDNVRDNDKFVLATINELAKFYFSEPAELNHVLAQIYYNVVNENGKERKAKISRHSDKTKDMPTEALMAFCTFYDDLEDLQSTNSHIKPSRTDRYDICYKHKESVLTKLRFRLKSDISQADAELMGFNDPSELCEKFDVVLYPGSVFMMSLLSNRLYTHEIIPSQLPMDLLPTRMGYVARCSDTVAKWQNDKVYIQTKSDGQFTELELQTEQGISDLKDMYWTENVTTDYVDYADKFMFSLNAGDYKKPIYSYDM